MVEGVVSGGVLSVTLPFCYTIIFIFGAIFLIIYYPCFYVFSFLFCLVAFIINFCAFCLSSLYLYGIGSIFDLESCNKICIKTFEYASWGKGIDGVFILYLILVVLHNYLSCVLNCKLCYFRYHWPGSELPAEAFVRTRKHWGHNRVVSYGVTSCADNLQYKS